MGRKPQQLVDFDNASEPEMEYLWEYYLDLQSSATGPLTFSELQAWSVVTRINVEPWEIDVIRTIDRIVGKVSKNG